MYGSFELWSIDHRHLLAHKLSGAGLAGLPLPSYFSGALFHEGSSYAWRVVASDGTLSSAPSKWCEFSVDNTAPDAPTISLPDFGSPDTGFRGFVGTPGRLIVGGGGRKAVEYQWANFGDFAADMACGLNGVGYGAKCTRAGGLADPVLFDQVLLSDQIVQLA